MVNLPTESTSTGQLVSGIVGTIDIGSLIAKSITISEDIARATTVLDRVNKYCSEAFKTLFARAISIASEDTMRIISDAKTYLPSYMQLINSNSRDAAIQASGGFGITAAMLGQEIKVYAAYNQVNLMSAALFEIPESIARSKLRHYYNWLIGPELPEDRDAQVLAQNGDWSWLDYTDYLRANMGLSEPDAKSITTVRQNQIGQPSLYDAWRMVQKKLLKVPDFLNLARKGQGWTLNGAMNLYSLFSYDFSPMEIMRMADFVPLEPAWIETKLSAFGLTDADKTILKLALSKRVLRDEINKEWGLLLDNYSWGLSSKTDMTKFLTDNYFTQAEITMRLTTADMILEKLRIKLLRDAQIYLYRKDVINEDQLLNTLVDLNIGFDIANAITRNEAAKKGIEWELETP